MSADDRRPQTLEEVRDVLDDDRTLPPAESRADAYRLVEQTLAHFDYARLRRADKGLVRHYLRVATGLSRAQVTRLLRQHRTTGTVSDRRGAPRRPFPRRYAVVDVELLAHVDALHGTLSARVTRRLLGRAHELFGDHRFARLAGISRGHLYNLRRSPAYLERRATTRAPAPPLPLTGRERWRPRPFPRPGHVRVAAVDAVVAARGSGPLAGLQLLELADEVTGFRLAHAVARLDTPALMPVIPAAHRAFPFPVVGFHPDRGSHPAERRAAGLLQAALAKRDAATLLPPSRAGDPGEAERHVEAVNAFFERALATYLNYHRVVLFSRDRADSGGRPRAVYRDDDIMTPYERLRARPGASAWLSPGRSFPQLDAIAFAASDNEAAREAAAAYGRLFPSGDPRSPAPRTANGRGAGGNVDDG